MIPLECGAISARSIGPHFQWTLTIENHMVDPEVTLSPVESLLGALIIPKDSHASKMISLSFREVICSTNFVDHYRSKTKDSQ